MNYIVQAVILVYFVGMFALGILGEQRTKNTADYYVAGVRSTASLPELYIPPVWSAPGPWSAGSARPGSGAFTLSMPPAPSL